LSPGVTWSFFRSYNLRTVALFAHRAEMTHSILLIPLYQAMARDESV
jgi:hypothetical protein